MRDDLQQMRDKSVELELKMDRVSLVDCTGICGKQDGMTWVVLLAMYLKPCALA
jgi:hypothetical protein